MERCRNFPRLTRDYMRVYKEMVKQKMLCPDMTEQEALEDAYKKGEIPIECKFVLAWESLTHDYWQLIIENNRRFRLLNILFSEQHYDDFVKHFTSSSRGVLQEKRQGHNSEMWDDVAKAFNQKDPETDYDSFIDEELDQYTGIDPGPLNGIYTKAMVIRLSKWQNQNTLLNNKFINMNGRRSIT